MTRTSPNELPRDAGSIAIYCAIVVPALLLIIGLTVDGGGKIRATERANRVAQEAARTAGQQLDAGQAITGTAIVVDPGKAVAAAQSYLAAAGATGDASVTDGGRQIVVTVNGPAYQTKFFSLMGISSLDVHGKATATLIYGVNGPEVP
ncbi:TadE/TadG family type IV pilus assembly protein [Kitasatospora kifunensis]|uniref:Flp pilus assembly protein TadG n=1 Tax=Kitasatospora kifunensis TaxID=58351 RepID=A0A7W7RCM1_KITKI|nr:TadE family protein [Kitasatospora kifunensis]MBB4929138.1 Flp pilus assembly protein TadG [Kitasatospora kifunensis]